MQAWAFDMRSRPAVLLASAFALWSLLVVSGGTEWFDAPASAWFDSASGNPALDGAMNAVTEAGDVWYMLGLAVVLIALPRTRRVGVAAMILLVLTTVITGYAKCAADRDRPEAEYDQGSFPVGISKDTFSLFCEGGYGASYPSGHASRAAALGALLGIALSARFPRWSHLMLLYPLAMSVSRVHVLQHYPADVAGGAMLGVLLAGIVARRTGVGAAR